MTTINSLLFLFSTLAPNVDHAGNNLVTQSPAKWNEGIPYGQNAPKLTQIACDIAEALRCDSHCQKNCSNYDKDIPCPDVCVLGCVCIDPFIRGPDGSCIMPYECPVTQDTPVITDTSEELVAIECHPDEEVSLYAHCQRNCTNLGQIILCPGEGAPGCVCKAPMVRGPEEGTCIVPEQCPAVLRTIPDEDDPSDMTCPDNEEVSCFAHCQPNCITFDKRIPCPMYCVQGCVCTPPLIRGPDGSCIMPEQCNSLKRPLLKKQCLDSEECNENDDEVSENDNDVLSRSFPDTFDNFKFCDDENEVYKVCSSQCPDNCDNYNDTRRACKLICLPLPKCECKPGYVRGPNGRCIEPEQCPHMQKNFKFCDDENEVYKVCSSQCPDNCENYNDTRRACKLICLPLPKCECKPGYVRGPNGRCIEPEQCSHMQKNFKSCDDENEVYKICSSQCPDTCENYNDTRRACKLICLPLPKCECKPGYVRGPNGRCIEPEQCSHMKNSVIFCPENEEFRLCGPACQKTCQNYDKDIPCEGVCQTGCFCKEPMIRGPNGRCIPKEECPAKVSKPRLLSTSNEVCGDNEVYKECGTACQKTCRNYHRNIPCEFKCEPGCFCEEEMVRSPNGQCIPKEECPTIANEPRQPRKKFLLKFPDLPKITCKENEEFSLCAPLCPDDCSNYKEDKLCKRICVPGCRCTEGYVKGKEGICVKKEDCEEKETNDCSDLEDYSDCGCETDCNNYNAVDHKCEDSNCKKGCFCKNGLVRSSEGTCIPHEECPAPNTAFWSMKSLRRKVNF